MITDLTVIRCGTCGGSYKFTTKAKAGSVLVTCSDCSASGQIKDCTVLVGTTSGFTAESACEPLSKPEKIPIPKDDTEEWVSLNFRVTPDQKSVIQAALGVMRARMKRLTPDVKPYHGLALEYICAEFVAAAELEDIRNGVDNKE